MLTTTRLLLLASACLVVAGLGMAEKGEPVQALGEYWCNLEGSWLFRTDPEEVGEEEGWQRPDFDDSDWRKLNAPGYWEQQGVTDPRPGQAPKPKDGTRFTDYDGTAWYRLRFVLPAKWAGQDLVLYLGKVDDYDRVFLNGELVGHTPRDVGDAVHRQRRYRVPGQVARFGAENVLAVEVTDVGGPGGIMGPLLSLLPEALTEVAMNLPEPDSPLAERFANPPAPARILKIVHSLPDDADSQDTLLETLVAQGFGGIVCNVSFQEYLASEDKWAAFVRGVKTAKDMGMALWLYDERGYPSGVAGGLVLRDHPEWQARGLLIAEAVSEGGEVTLDLPPGTLVTASAFPLTGQGIVRDGAVDLADRVREGKLSWNAPAGRWRVIAITDDYLYEGTHAALSLADKLPYINLLMPEPTARFIEVTHAAYARHLGDDLGQWFVATFTDEPSLMSLFLRPMPYSVLPWGPNVAEEFRRRRGYDLQPLLPLLVADAGGAEKRVRYDFWLTVAELVADSFFGQIQDWCRAHNVLSGGHLLMEESVAGHVPLYGDFLRCVRRTDAPSIDCLTSLPPQVPWQIARLISSAADLDGNAVTMCETSDHVQRYRGAGDERPVRLVTADEIRGTCNRLILGGINVITSYYSFSGLDGRDLRGINEWVGRCCTMLAGGHQVTDVAVLYPVESLWPHHTPARRGATESLEVAQIEALYNGAAQQLYAARRDFTYVDSRTLAEARVQDGALVHGALRWQVVVLPGADTLPLAAWENLGRFWRSGGVIASLGSLPANSETEFPSPRVQELAAEVFGSGEEPRVHTGDTGGVGIFLPRGCESLLALVLGRVLEPDLASADQRSALRYTHRRVDDHEVYFIINDSAEPCRDTVTVAAEGPGEWWFPATGQTAPLGEASRIGIELGPYQAVLLRFPHARQPRRLPVESGGLPGVSLAPWPSGGEPGVGKGEFVEAELSRDEEHSTADLPAWRAVGKLTKGDVDTFLFVTFRCERPADLTDADSIVVDTWVPAGQRTPGQILLILAESSGANYLAHTGRALSRPGRQQCFVPLSSFSLAGWSKEDPNGKLDLGDIGGISIGWGGYYGAEGEVVEFSLSAPRIGKLGR